MLDFGSGFYTTSNKEQAQRWASKVSARRNAIKQYISIYDFDLEQAKKELMIINFNKPDEAWLNFICTCRSGREPESDYDIAIGPVADDNVYATVQLYELGVLNTEETLKRLKVEKLYNQILFHSEKSLTFCNFKKSICLGGGINE